MYLRFSRTAHLPGLRDPLAYELVRRMPDPDPDPDPDPNPDPNPDPDPNPNPKPNPNPNPKPKPNSSPNPNLNPSPSPNPNPNPNQVHRMLRLEPQLRPTTAQLLGIPQRARTLG